MAYHIFSATAPQNQNLRQLKQTLATARNLAQIIKRQNDNMSAADKTAQWGVPGTLNEAQWDATIDGLLATGEGLDEQAIVNFISLLGFDQ